MQQKQSPLPHTLPLIITKKNVFPPPIKFQIQISEWALMLLPSSKVDFSTTPQAVSFPSADYSLLPDAGFPLIAPQWTNTESPSPTEQFWRESQWIGGEAT
mmetsp:Transcript_11349/g.42578  ORF Transcript_11349/g.42578 Transcript_11349/m.42578 type:complete len:101 (+) Transcript_11349:2154-2456(+)